MPISTTQEIVDELRAGRMVILVDEEDRENEGDLVLAAEHVTPEAINFMIRHARGLVCLTLSEEICDRLELPMMTTRNGTSFGGGGEGCEAGRPRPARPHLPVARRQGRRADARRPHRSGLRPDGNGGPDPGVRDLRDHQGGRHDGAPAGPAGVRAGTQPEDRHHRRPDPLPQPERDARRARGGASAADRARRVQAGRLPRQAERLGAPGARPRHAAGRPRDARARAPAGVHHRPAGQRVDVALVEPRGRDAGRAAGGGGRHRPARLRGDGRRTVRPVRGQAGTPGRPRGQPGPAHVRHRRADPAPAGRAQDEAARQPAQNAVDGRFRPRGHRLSGQARVRSERVTRRHNAVPFNY
ncbi:hypothetical protein Lal_00014838 [Lupinus albus]|nr:hypothetical protein Lal_00014838 [Lupinus albus]